MPLYLLCREWSAAAQRYTFLCFLTASLVLPLRIIDKRRFVNKLLRPGAFISADFCNNCFNYGRYHIIIFYLFTMNLSV